MIVFICCTKNKIEKNETKKDITPNSSYINDFNNEKKKADLIKKIIKEGDTISYKKLKNIYFLSNYTTEFLKYSIVMANDYNYDLAFLDAYIILRIDPTYKANLKINKLANYYLLRAYELNPKIANSLMKEKFGSSYPHIKASEYWKLVNE